MMKWVGIFELKRSESSFELDNEMAISEEMKREFSEI
jgi:hypothetical protein